MKLAILDRDGTLNLPGDGYIASPDEWIALPGALEAVARLNHAGWHVVLACNQPGLGRGLFDVKVLNAIHAKMYRQLAAAGGRIDAVFFCPHAPQEACGCRLPQPELIAQICERYGVEAAQVLVVGSSMALLQAGAALGARQLHLLQRADAVGAAALGACRTLDVDSENAPQRGQFLPDSPPHSGTMGQEGGKKWVAAAHLQPTIPKSDRLLGMGMPASAADAPLAPLPEVQKHVSLGALVGHLLQAETAAEAPPLPVRPAQA